MLVSGSSILSLPHPGHRISRKTPGRWSATKMMCTHLSLEVNPYAIRSRYWCDSLVQTKSMTQIYVMLYVMSSGYTMTSHVSCSSWAVFCSLQDTLRIQSEYSIDCGCRILAGYTQDTLSSAVSWSSEVRRRSGYIVAVVS